MSRRHLALWVLIAFLFTLVQVRQSLHGGRLALPPTFDDVGYLRDAQIRLHVFFDQGPIGGLAHMLRSVPHSPWSSLLALVAFLAFGVREWAPAAANGLLVLGVLLWLARRGRRLPLAWQLAAGAVLLTWPLLGQAIENFRPDIACGLLTAALALYIVREPWIGAGRRRHYLAGLGFALALLIKPTISPVTSLIVIVALGAATLTDVAREPWERRWREIATAWARCLGTGAVLAAPYYVLAAEHLSGYMYRNTFGELKDVWSLRLSGREQALYYLSGEGGRLMLAGWFYWWIAVAVAALLAALARRDGSAFARVPAVVAVVAVSYAAVTLPAHKNPFLGAVLPGLLMFTAIEMMVYLAKTRAPEKTTVTGRWVLAALLVLGVAGYRWPYQLTAGGPLTPEGHRQHRRLLETVYRDLRHVGGEKTRVFFTQISAFLNPPLLEYRAGLDRLGGFSSRDLQLSKKPLHLDHELTLADHVIAFSPGNRNALRWLPGYETQSLALERLGIDPELSLVGIYGTVGGGEVYLFSRATGFRGIRSPVGLGPLEGPYPQWGLHSQVRWAMGPVTRFEVRLQADAHVRLTWNARADFPDQTMTVKVSGRAIHSHRFSAPGVFERREILHDLTTGRHQIEIEHSHWHDPSEQDDRPRAVLLQTFTVLPFFDSTVIAAPNEAE